MMEKTIIATNDNKVRVLACALCGGNCWGCFSADECPDWQGACGGHRPTVLVDPATVDAGWL